MPGEERLEPQLAHALPDQPVPRLASFRLDVGARLGARPCECLVRDPVRARPRRNAFGFAGRSGTQSMINGEGDRNGSSLAFAPGGSEQHQGKRIGATRNGYRERRL